MMVDMTITPDKIAAELESVRRESRIISFCVWGVAIGVMIYGAGNVFDLLADHQVPKSIAWILSPMVDAGLCVGLVATRGLTRHGQPTGWIGTLRWVTALMTWTLNIAAPLTGTNAAGEITPDWLGVFIHSVGPFLLFVVVEGAAHYQHRMAAVIAAKQGMLEEIEAKHRAEVAERDALREQVRTLTAEHSAALTEAEQSTARLAELEAERTTERVSSERLRDTLHADMETLRQEHAETIERIRTEHAEALTAARTESSAVNLSEYRDSGRSGQRRGVSGKPPAKPTKPRISDEEAVQRCIDANKDPHFEWSQAEVVRVSGVGFGRAPRIVSAIAEWHARALTGSRGEAAPARSGEGVESLTNDPEEEVA